MKKPLASILFAGTLALLLAAGTVQAQFKAPDRSRPADPLGRSVGSGLGSGAGSGGSSLGGGAASTPPATTPQPAAASGTAAENQSASGEAIIQEIADCMLAGLPADWTMAQIDVRELGRKEQNREFEAIYSYLDADGKAGAFTPCDQKGPAMNVYKLNGALEPSKRNWIRATLVLSKEGKFELQYDYATAKDADKTAAPAAAAKKDPKKTPAKKN